MDRFRLTDGSVIEAVKDCDCLDRIHEGPHWLYMNDLWRASNERLRVDGNIRGYIFADLPRVREKRFYMERYGIIEILREE